MKNNKVVALSLFIGSILFFFLHSCSTSSQPKEGFIDVEGGKIWYRIVGEGDKTPVLLLHGGPGSSSFYLEPLKELSDEKVKAYYMPLPKHTNQVKRNKCKTCFTTKKRPCGPNGIKFFFEGDDNYIKEIGCKGCPWAYPEMWGKEIQKYLPNKG